MQGDFVCFLHGSGHCAGNENSVGYNSGIPSGTGVRYNDKEPPTFLVTFGHRSL